MVLPSCHLTNMTAEAYPCSIARACEWRHSELLLAATRIRRQENQNVPISSCLGARSRTALPRIGPLPGGRLTVELITRAEACVFSATREPLRTQAPNTAAG